MGKKVFCNCLLKAFLLENGWTSSYHKASEELKAGHEVYMFVHVKGYGHWQTSRVTKITQIGLLKRVETRNHTYKMIGNEPAVRIKAAFFTMGNGVNLPMRDDVEKNRIKSLIEDGQPVKAMVYLEDSMPHLTSNIIFLNSKEFISNNYTVYRW